MKFKNLSLRLLFALWAIPPGWWLINSQLVLVSGTRTPLLPGHLTVVLTVFLATYEYLRMLAHAFPRNGFWMVYIWLLMQMISYFNPDNFLSTQLDIYVLLVLVAIESLAWGHQTSRWKRASLLFSGTLFLSIASYALMSLFGPPFELFFPTNSTPLFSRMGFMFVLTSVFMCDSAAYFAGSLWGKHHFSSISPKKTIEGSIGGLIAAIITSTLGWIFFADDRYPVIWGIGMGVLIGTFAQLGDLVVSTMKRYFRVKDASNIIPGHGGILDRFDSLFFTAPLLNLYFALIAKFYGLT